MPMKIRIAATTAICALSANMAMAQSESASDKATTKEQTPDTVTCADITAMDTAMVPGTLYYIAGYKTGSDAGMSSGGGSGQMDAADTSKPASGDMPATTAADGSTVTSDADTSADSAIDKPASDATTAADGSTMTSDANTSADSGTDATAPLAADGSAPTPDANGSAAATSEDTEADSGMAADAGSDQASTANGDVAIMRVSGMFEIPVEEVITVCTDSPEMKATDAIEQKRSESGADSAAN